MNVLITGAGGFVGSHLAERCVELGHRVRAMVRYTSTNHHGWLESSPLRSQMEVVTGDVRDYDSVMAATRGVDAVFHLAALIGIPYSYVSPLAYVKTNVEGTYNVLQAARERSIPNVLVTSTSETYGSAQFVPMTELHPMVGQSPYSASKIGADNLAVSYFRSFGLPVKIVRPFNVFGPRQSARAIIPSVIIQILAGKKNLKLGNLTPTRDLTFVKDTVEGFLAISRVDRFNGEYVNIGVGSEISVGDLVKTISRLMKVEVQIETEEARVRPGLSEVERLFCDNRKLTAATDWKPRHDLESGLLQTIEFLKAHQSLYKADLYNV